MARQIIDTTTNNGTYIGDPAKVAFEKTNANFSELYTTKATLGSVASFSEIGPSNSNQGFQVTWNTVQAGQGRNEYISNRGGGTGGHYFFNRSVSSDSAVLSMYSRPDGEFFSVGGVNSSQNFSSTSVNVVLSTGTTNGQVYLRPSGSGSTIGQATLNSAGTMTVVSLTQTSSADVKDYIEGFCGDASELLDKLVVISHRYKPSFIDETEKSHISLLAENVLDVIPSAIKDQDEEPLSVNIMEILSVSVRAHQQKNARIKHLESVLSDIVTRLMAAGI